MNHTKQEGRALSRRVRFPLGTKLVSIITSLLLFSLGAITIMVSVLVTNDLRVTAETNNFTANTRSATEAERILGETRDDMMILMRTLSIISPDQSEAFIGCFFEEKRDIAAAAILDGEPAAGSGELREGSAGSAASAAGNKGFRFQRLR
jgi:adenylate cyclase